MPLSSHPQVEAFLSYLKFQKRYSRHTVISYQNDLEQFQAFVASTYEVTDLAQVPAMYIKSWLAKMRGDQTEPVSLKRKMSALRSFFKFQMLSGSIKASPMTAIVVPKAGKRLPVFVAEQDMVILQEKVQFPDTLQGHTDKLILELLYDTGIRLAELISLQEKNVDVAQQQIKVLGKGNKERIIPISPALSGVLQAYINFKHSLDIPPATEVFVTAKGKPLYPKYVYKVVNDNLSYVTTIRKKSPHVLRHTIATHLANNGADLNVIKDLLGHASLASTQVYTHNTIEKLKEAYKKAHPKA